MAYPIAPNDKAFPRVPIWAASTLDAAIRVKEGGLKHRGARNSGLLHLRAGLYVLCGSGLKVDCERLRLRVD